MYFYLFRRSSAIPTSDQNLLLALYSRTCMWCQKSNLSQLITSQVSTHHTISLALFQKLLKTQLIPQELELSNCPSKLSPNFQSEKIPFQPLISSHQQEATTPFPADAIHIALFLSPPSMQTIAATRLTSRGIPNSRALSYLLWLQIISQT